MSHHQHQALQASAGTDKVAGCWKLGPGRALTLRATRPSVLRIAQGLVWLTFDNAHHDGGVRGGDHFLGAGDSVRLLSGQALVMESYSAPGPSVALAAFFSWDPLPATSSVATASRRVPVFSTGPAWRNDVLQPLSDLRAAFVLAGKASARLLCGLAGTSGVALRAMAPRFAIDFVAVRARSVWAERAFNAQPKASRAHCAIS